MMTEEGAFSIITSYLRLAAREEKILAFRADEYYWRDLGRPENVAQAASGYAAEAFFVISSWRVGLASVASTFRPVFVRTQLGLT